MRTLSLLSILLLGPASASATTPPLQASGGGDGGEAQRPAEARFEKMLLHLADGRVLRVRARPADGAGGWEVRAGRDEVQVLPAAAVTRAALERDVLDEAQRLAGDVDRDDPVRRTALAAWMFDQGLWEEGIDELDPVLGRAPDQPEAVALLRRTPPPLALPELEAEADSLAGFVRQVAGARPVAREVAVQRIAALAERSDLPFDLRAELCRELIESSLRRRAFAALALRRIFPGEEIKPLLSRAVLDGSGDVRAEAALALRAADDPAVMLPVLRALGSSSSAVRANAAEALGHMGYPQAVAPLVGHLSAVNTLASGGYTPPRANIFVGKQLAYVQDYDVEVAQGSAIADPTINTLMEGAVLDVRVLGVSQMQLASEKATVRDALARLTGASPGRTTRAWTDWWDEHGTEWLASFGAPASSNPTSPGH
jgi:HEAT repeat protein